MSTDVFRKVGRGGAGNFYSQKDVEEVQNANTEDLEAQKPSDLPLDAAPPPSSDQAGTYARAGRGGAGNFYDRATAADSTEQEKEVAEKAKAAIATNLAAKGRVGATGRGGMGNFWADSAVHDAQVRQEEQKKAQEIAAKTLQDVEAGLAPPPRAYQQHDRDMQK
ncbi:hypothetical protein GQ53DRAFT_788507 [Thozetella sp. PMI_491]|nr:hypothetical protein GQ53DRAFT_788507 [Thozetella sp. PMI_491]